MERHQVETLIRTKLRPPLTRQQLVPRPRLRAQIAQGLHRPLTLVTAPAGFGKTTLVAAALAGCDLPVAWLSLDADDNQVGRFLSYLVAALREANETVGGDAAQLLAGMQPPSPEAVLTSLINDLDAAAAETVLVLDDYQFIHSQPVHELVAFLLAHCPPTLHLVIATRSDPPLPLTRLRARAQMVELRAAELGFTEPEAAQFLNEVMGLDIDARSVAVLKARTEGWVAGLQMAALSMRGREDVDRLVQAFAGTHRFIMDFMLEEVLARESEEVQSFLLQTSVLTRLSGPLVDAVTGASGGQEMLELLERRNLFLVPLDDERRWYRYHHLFADLLQARLRQAGSDRPAQLLSHAAAWCEQEGLVAEAISYALAAPDYGQATRLVARYWSELANRGEIETAWSWLNALPKEMVRESAPLSTACCWLLWLRGELNAIEGHLVDAERALDGLIASGAFIQERVAYASLPAELAALRASVARYHSEFEAAIAHGERALSLMPEGLPPQTDAQLRTLALLGLATSYDGAGDLERAAGAYAETVRLSRLGEMATGLGITMRLVEVLRVLGRLRAADTACRDALEYVQAQGMARLPAAGVLHVAMSEVLVEQNDLQAAEDHLAQGFELGKWSGRLDAARNAPYALSRLRHARGDTNGALAAVEEAESALADLSSLLSRAELLALRARVLVRQGALDEAARCVAEAVGVAGWDRGVTGQMLTLAASRVRLAQSQADEALAEVGRSLAAAEERSWFGAALELRILRSLALARRGDRQGAETDLARALALAEPEGYVRVFLDEGQPMQRLLAQWLARANAGPLRDHAVYLLSQFAAEPLPVVAPHEETSSAGAPSISAQQALVEPLTERELEVLHLVALGMSNRAIADHLVIARGTVKAHTAAIYRKLDVANRTEAVARARQLGMLP